MSVTAEVSATAVTSSSATTPGSLALALTPCFAGKFVSSTSSFMPSVKPCARPPSRYATASATYFTLKTVRRLGSSLRAIRVDVSAAAASGAARGAEEAEAAGADSALPGLASTLAISGATVVAATTGAAVSGGGTAGAGEPWAGDIATAIGFCPTETFSPEPGEELGDATAGGLCVTGAIGRSGAREAADEFSGGGSNAGPGAIAGGSGGGA